MLERNLIFLNYRRYLGWHKRFLRGCIGRNRSSQGRTLHVSNKNPSNMVEHPLNRILWNISRDLKSIKIEQDKTEHDWNVYGSRTVKGYGLFCFQRLPNRWKWIENWSGVYKHLKIAWNEFHPRAELFAEKTPSLEWSLQILCSV